MFEGGKGGVREGGAESGARKGGVKERVVKRVGSESSARVLLWHLTLTPCKFWFTAPVASGLIREIWHS